MKSTRKSGAISSVFAVIFSAFSAIFFFLKGLVEAFFRLNFRERVIFFSLSTVLIALIFIVSYRYYYKITIPVPAFGGTYREVLVGEAKYFNPILAKTDAERELSHLIYSALIKIDENGLPQPDLAQSWEISEDGLNYTFHLRQDVTYHKGQTFDSSDVAATISAIMDESVKSPFRESWSNVTTETPDPYTVIFKIPKKYGPFIYNCAMEIVDSEDTFGLLSSKYNGTGPYEYVSSSTDKSGVLNVKLKASDNYYLQRPNISSMEFVVSNTFDQNKIHLILDKNSDCSAYCGADSKNENYNDYRFVVNRRLILFFNLRREAIQNIDLRKNILSDVPNGEGMSLKLVALDAEPQKSKAQIEADRLKAAGFEANLNILSANDYAETVKKRDFDLLFYGYDWSYDMDPYFFWHSSQMDKNNFSGYSDKSSDIQIEDARQILDNTERIAEYQEIYDKITSLALAKYFDNESLIYYVEKNVQGMEIKKQSGRPEDRFNNITNWFIKEKRVRK